MSLFKKLCCLGLAVFLFVSCGRTESNSWTQFVPNETPFIVIPAKGSTLHQVLNSKYLPLLDDVSSSSIALIHKIDSTAVNALNLESILLYPGTDQKLQPIWIAEASGRFIENMEKIFSELYGQQYYYFEDVPILKIRTNQELIFAAQISDLLLISESSLGIENAIRTYRNKQPAAKLTVNAPKPGTLIMNTPALERWLTQQAKVIYYSDIQQSFTGTEPARLSITYKDSTAGGGVVLEGFIPISDASKSTLINAISFKNAPVALAKYIPFGANAFAFFRLPPPQKLPEKVAATTEIDSFLVKNPSFYQKISKTLGSAFAMAMFAESGMRSVNEHAFIRKVKAPSRLKQLLNKTANKNLIQKIDDEYFVQSRLLCRLIGSELCGFSTFYLKVVDEAVIIAPRRGLVEMIASDYRRRQVVYYEKFYKMITKRTPAQISGLVVGGKKLITYLSPFLKTESYVRALTARFDYISLSARKAGSKIKFKLATYNLKSEQQPYIENWFFPLHASLSGPPIFADITGSPDKEVIFATKAGEVYIFAADGTLIRTYKTQNEVPIGSPVAYDWYNTGEKVVLIAAGNKIFAWDETGELLPGFPFVLNERITAPLIVTDLNKNGLSDIIAATANRKLHVINARGSHLRGWPVKTNTPINTKPIITNFRGQTTVAAFASNAIHVWGVHGDMLAGFPRFIDASFVGSPVSLNNEIIGAAADGSLYSFGPHNIFADTLNSTGGGFFFPDDIEVLSVSSSALVSTPLVHNQTKIVALNATGTVYLFNKNGVLQLVKSIGRPPAPGWTPVITDINSDGKKDIIVLANFGRLYAWSIKTGKRIQKLPNTALNNVTIGDVDGDGLIEVVGKTPNGVYSWTIN